MAGIVHALTLLVVVLVAAPLAQHVPLAALAGILMFVAWNMGEWREFARLRQFLLPYRTVMLGTFVLTVVFDLTIAVEFGLLGACGFFVWRMSTLFQVTRINTIDAAADSDVAASTTVECYELYGSLFFGAVGKLEGLPGRLAPNTSALVLDMHRLVSMDTSGLDALEHLHRLLERRHIALVLASVNQQPLSLMQRSGFAATLGTEALCADLAAAIGAAQAHRTPPATASA